MRLFLIVFSVLFFTNRTWAQPSKANMMRLRVDQGRLLRLVEGLRLSKEPQTRIHEASHYERSFSVSALGIPSGSSIEVTEVKDYLAPRKKGLFLSAILHIRGGSPRNLAISYFSTPQEGFLAITRVALPHPRLSLSHVYEISVDSARAHVRRVPSYALAAVSCPQQISDGDRSAGASDNLFYSSLLNFKGGTVELITDTDEHYVNYFGTRLAANRNILAVINTTDTVLRHELNVRISVLAQFNSSDYPDIPTARGLLCSVSGKEFPPADTVLLFSGKHLQESPPLVGLAWEGGICVSKRQLAECRAYVFVNRALIRGGAGGIFDHIILTHELGHNLGAPHDMDKSSYFMGRTLDLSRLPETFSAQSRKIFYRILHGGVISAQGIRLPHSWQCLSRNSRSFLGEIPEVRISGSYDLHRHRICTAWPPERSILTREFYPDFIKWYM